MNRTERLPPLSALRAFEAAGRRLSFTAAAEDVFVTQAAISHQIRALEEFLGLELFIRHNRRLTLTDAGRRYFEEIETAFDSVRRATRRAMETSGEQNLRISALSSFTTKWLIPRLHRFQTRHPDIEPMIGTTQRAVDLRREGVDVAIRVGGGVYEGLLSTKLMDDAAFPVCAPSLVHGPKPLATPQDLRAHVLIHDSSIVAASEGPDWPAWFKAAGLDPTVATSGPAYNDTGLTIQAAIAAQGVALARRVLVSDDLAHGHLVRPFGPDVPAQSSWYFVTTPDAGERPAVKALLAWLLEEIATAGL
ncbi:transcriptional regulator GcvA [Pelagibacterium sp. 26DY04]|uniref:transcriptional regulator GcvA n=1 Tax=Pelagibacterium sp. 26DY04 TaxID=2967130 RepID=UPI002815E690|nr:transcriptional regulator GcvA [Pelagibacterium sp. 26DY04]WMT88598.1 transcriptional regulator GcvA [Pelagibacterium sp. 26DY04]